jgi:hypothetical protein
MMTKSKPKNWAAGRWLIVSMDQWDEDYLNEEGEAFIEFEAHNSGQFHFGYVHGEIDYRLTTRDGKAAVEFTWDGHDEMDPAQGRGWAVLEGEELKGETFFHQGDDSGFIARRAAVKPKRKKR